MNQIYDPAIANSENGLCSVGVEYLGIDSIARTDPFLKRIVGPFECENSWILFGRELGSDSLQKHFRMVRVVSLDSVSCSPTSHLI